MVEHPDRQRRARGLEDAVTRLADARAQRPEEPALLLSPVDLADDAMGEQLAGAPSAERRRRRMFTFADRARAAVDADS